MNSINQFLSGAIAVQYLIASLFFWRYGIKTADKFFGFFALAFAILAFERVVWALGGLGDELRPAVYLFRVAAFLLIIVAVLVKNSQSHPD